MVLAIIVPTEDDAARNDAKREPGDVQASDMPLNGWLILTVLRVKRMRCGWTVRWRRAI